VLVRIVGSRCESFRNEINKGEKKLINRVSTALTERLLAPNRRNRRPPPPPPLTANSGKRGEGNERNKSLFLSATFWSVDSTFGTRVLYGHFSDYVYYALHNTMYFSTRYVNYARFVFSLKYAFNV